MRLADMSSCIVSPNTGECRLGPKWTLKSNSILNTLQFSAKRRNSGIFGDVAWLMTPPADSYHDPYWETLWERGTGGPSRGSKRDRDKGKKSERKSFRSSYERIKDGTRPKWKCLYELLSVKHGIQKTVGALFTNLFQFWNHYQGMCVHKLACLYV